MIKIEKINGKNRMKWTKSQKVHSEGNGTDLLFVNKHSYFELEGFVKQIKRLYMKNVPPPTRKSRTAGMKLSSTVLHDMSSRL